jgi:hypothetical protein
MQSRYGVNGLRRAAARQTLPNESVSSEPSRVAFTMPSARIKEPFRVFGLSVRLGGSAGFEDSSQFDHSPRTAIAFSGWSFVEVVATLQRF